MHLKEEASANTSQHYTCSELLNHYHYLAGCFNSGGRFQVVAELLNILCLEWPPYSSASMQHKHAQIAQKTMAP